MVEKVLHTINHIFKVCSSVIVGSTLVVVDLIKNFLGIIKYLPKILFELVSVILDLVALILLPWVTLLLSIVCVTMVIPEKLAKKGGYSMGWEPTETLKNFLYFVDGRINQPDGYPPRDNPNTIFLEIMGIYALELLFIGCGCMALITGS